MGGALAEPNKADCCWVSLRSTQSTLSSWIIGTAAIPVPGGFPSERFANANVYEKGGDRPVCRQVGWALSTTPSIHPPPAPRPQTQGHFSFDGGCSLAQAFYVVGFCKDGAAVEGDQGEKDGTARCINASIIGHVRGKEDTLR